MTVGSDGDGGDGRMDVRMGQLLLLALTGPPMDGGGWLYSTQTVSADDQHHKSKK